MKKTLILTAMMSMSIFLTACAGPQEVPPTNPDTTNGTPVQTPGSENANVTTGETTNQAPSSTQAGEGVTDEITVEEAKEIAIKHANLAPDQIMFIKAERDFDDGMEKYDVEFYVGDKEYDYEIHAKTGEILSYDFDVENYDIKAQVVPNSETKISVEEAKELALKHANLTADQVKFARAEFDFDDGIEKYDIEFYVNNIEYNYEVDANNGQILAFEQD